jgi:hypothetical protein
MQGLVGGGVILTHRALAGHVTGSIRAKRRSAERRAVATKAQQDTFAFPSKKKEPIGDAEHVATLSRVLTKCRA